MSELMTVTPKAAERIKALMAKREEPVAGLKLGTRVAGCSGFMYELDFVADAKADDAVVEVDGVRLFIESGSVPYLQGVEMDWQEDTFATGFVFNNPNATSLCGCGESFKVDG
ncbi:MAG: HesB/IscA family protein [Rhodothalassiaceae bacterium]